MSSTNKRFLAAYTVLVALPIVGLLGVLKHGRHLSAPVSVDGTWRLQVDPGAAASFPCTIPASEKPVLIISQSGERFTVSVVNTGKSSGEGFIEGTALNASLQSANSPNSNCADHGLTLVAKVDPSAKPRSLAGTLSVNDCASCAPLSFQAIKDAQPGPKGVH